MRPKSRASVNILSAGRYLPELGDKNQQFDLGGKFEDVNVNEALNGVRVFESERLIGRRWKATDFEMILTTYSDPDVARWIGDSSLLTPEDTHAWLAVTAKNYHTRGYGMFALEDRDSGEIAGFIGLVHPGGQAQAEVKYALRQSFWGRGLASEVVKAIVAYADLTLRLPMLIATVAPQNIASQKVLLKAGFSFVTERDDDDGQLEFYYERHAE